MLPNVTALPSGNVTFLFTDIEQSTRSWEDDASAMEQALARHDEILRSAVESLRGYVFSTGGDGFCVAFARAQNAIDAAVNAQRALATEAWPETLTLRVRMGLHSGEAQERESNYFGPTVNRAARIMDAAHGGQILVSDTVAAAVEWSALLDLGRHWLKDLPTRERLWELVTDPAARFPPPRTLGSGAATNVPPADETLVGRHADVEAVRSLLSDHRLVTVVGVGGIGKTRLALDVARTMVGNFDDGVWLCELAPVGEPDAVAHAVAKVLGTRQHPGRSMVESVAEFCRRRQLLLVLDNCEHVLDAAGALADALMSIAPQAAVLATSREAMGCRGEQAYPLSSLGIEGDGSPAVELFTRRAAETMPGRDWDDEDRAAMGRICRRLDGMPLAIELAAGRVRSLSPAEIEERLDSAFRVLRGGRRSIERHRTLAAAIDWSYELLDDMSAVLFDRLSVFAGGWDLAAAEAVCADGEMIDSADVADLLDDLVLKSLVVAEHSAHRATRYRLLEPLRQYAEDRLAARGDTLRLRNAHANYFCRWAEEWAEKSWSDELAWRLALEKEFGNLRAGITWAIDTGDEDRALRTIAAIERAQGPFLLLEIADWAKRAVELPAAADHPLGPVVCGTGAIGFWWRNDLATATELVERGEGMACYDAAALQTNGMRFVLRLSQGDPTAFEVLDRIDLRDPATAMTFWARTAWHPEPRPGDVAALRSFESATESAIVSIMADQADAWTAQRTNDRERGAELHRRTISRASELGARFFLHMSVAGLGQTAGVVGTLTAADIEMVRLSLREQRDCGQEMDQWLVLMTAAVVMIQHGRHALAKDIYRGLRASPWSSAPATQDLGAVFFGDENESPFDSDLPPALATLVDAVIDELDTILLDPSPPGA
jgi:predicted ATPase/class 3 adenylate cyclase